jgi:hypothetical protein
VSAIASQIVQSIYSEPHRWRFRTVTFSRNDGLSVDVIKPFDGSRNYAKLNNEERDNVEFGWFDRWRIQRAFRWWKLRPIAEPPLKEKGL